MALAEARAAWQRTANRCLVQEDAKRAPKLACCPSVVTSPVKQSETETEIEIEPLSAHNNGQTDIPITAPLPFNRTPSCSNLSPCSRWWLQMQPNYGYQKVLMEKQSSSSSVEGRNESCCTDSPQSLEEFVGCEVSKDAGEDAYFFDSESSWIGSGRKSTPWWRTADTEELALLVAQRSLDVLENCDLPRPQNSRVKKGTRRFSNDDNGALDSKLVRKVGVGSLIAGDSNRDRVKSIGDQIVLDADISLRMSPTNEKLHAVEGDSTRAQLLDALRHSQTRAREAEEVMKKTCAEKEYVVKLVLRQASQLFAYKQWVQLLQLENKCLQFKNSKNDEPAASTVFSPTKPLPWKGLGNRKTRKGWPLNRKRARRGRAWCDFGKYAIAYALGLGLVGAGFLLGWTVGLLLPTWCEM